MITIGQVIVLVTLAFLLLFALGVSFGEAMSGKDEKKVS